MDRQLEANAQERHARHPIHRRGGPRPHATDPEPAESLGFERCFDQCVSQRRREGMSAGDEFSTRGCGRRGGKPHRTRQAAKREAIP